MNNLKDSQSLLDLIYETAKTRDVQSVVFTGDLTNEHGVLRLEVANLIKNNVKRLSEIATVAILVGNHDGSSPHSIEVNSLRMVLEGMSNVLIFDKPDLYYNFYMLPFTASNDQFVQWCNVYPDKMILCHQTFDGAQYENGFYAVGGVDQNLIRNPLIIGGHIHKFSSFGRVTYVGSPRALNANEYNESKYIWIFDDEKQEFLDKVKTDHYVKCFYKVELNEGDDLVPIEGLYKVKPNDSVAVYINGSQEYVDSVKARIPENMNNFKIIPLIKRELSKSISIDGIDNSTEKAMKEYLDTVLKVPEHIKEDVWQTIATLI
jgi:DNA repair exonuclease SbcCD nuclease subunit